MNDIESIRALTALTGTELGVSDWVAVSQEMIDAFAAVSGDDQWIHTDADRAAAGPFGGTIAHGLLTLCLLPALAAQTFRVGGVTGRINYGYDRIRFPHPVLAGSRIRDRIRLTAVSPVPGGARAHLVHSIEIEGVARPACVAEAIVQFEGQEQR